MAESTETSLRFDAADASAGASTGATCGVCGQPIEQAYFTLGTQVSCERCKTRIELERQQRPGLSGVAKAIVFGSFWGLLGAGVWWAVRTFASLEIGLIAVAIGYFVGHAVFRASGGRGGRGFQVLAVALTYFWICANYVPDLAQALTATTDEGGVASRLLLAGILFGVAMASPFLEGASNALGLLIIGFGLLQAWQINKRTLIEFAGPFSVAANDMSDRMSGMMSSRAPGASG